MAEVRNNWEGQIINGVFPLRRFLGSSDHSSVFLTESTVEGFLNAAIKIVPSDPAHSPVQLWHWKTAATFSHPHLIRLLDSGQCAIDGREFLFVVMEYAEESLSQILPYRALGPDEVRELLVPTLDALAFLHREDWVQGQLKPSNFLVVNDQLKLATDTIRPVAVSRVMLPRPSIYEPPESDEGDVSAAGDIWALGVTMVEALTQYPPTWLNGRAEAPSFPTNLPPVFADTVQRCLSRNPADRPTVAELQAQTKPMAAPASPPAPLHSTTRPGPLTPVRGPEPPMRADSRVFAEPVEESKRGLLVPALVSLVVVGVVVWGGSRLFRGHAKPEQTAEAVAPETAAPVATPAPPPEAPPPRANATATTSNGRAPARNATATAPTDNAAVSTPPPPRKTWRANTPPQSASRGQSSATGRSAAGSPAAGANSAGVSAAGASAALHEEIPSVPLSARGTIHGHVKVGVRVTVDRSGRVVHDSLDNPGPSRYFNRLASEAARKWRFAAADDRGSREWLLRFEFGRDGTTVHAVGPRS
jgi:TonB family protein